jgi:homoserine dehydrogenase
MIAELAQSLGPRADSTLDQPQHLRSVRVALLGCGVIGREIARVLIDERQRIGRETGVDIELVRVLVRDPSRERGLSQRFFTADFAAVLRDRPDVLVEVLGGVHPAVDYIETALERGIPVVTANKSVIASHVRRLRESANRSGVRLAYEAAVGAAIPVIAAMRQRLGDPLVRIQAVLNGSCNFILTRMAQSECDLRTALAEATALGLVEPDPTADISGRDTAEKLCILAAEAGCDTLTPNDVSTCGIEALTTRDILAARSHGCVIKLLAELRVSGDAVSANVGPTLIPRRHPLAMVDGADNAMLIEHEYGGPLLLQGCGAGPKPTASALLGDLLSVLGAAPQGGTVQHRKDVDGRDADTSLDEPAPRRRFVRISGSPGALTPQSVLETLRDHGAHAHHLEFRHGSVEAITEPTAAAALHNACQSLVQTSAAPWVSIPLLE